MSGIDIILPKKKLISRSSSSNLKDLETQIRQLEGTIEIYKNKEPPKKNGNFNEAFVVHGLKNNTGTREKAAIFTVESRTPIGLLSKQKQEQHFREKKVNVLLPLEKKEEIDEEHRKQQFSGKRSKSLHSLAILSSLEKPTDDTKRKSRANSIVTTEEKQSPVVKAKPPSSPLRSAGKQRPSPRFPQSGSNESLSSILKQSGSMESMRKDVTFQEEEKLKPTPPSTPKGMLPKSKSLMSLVVKRKDSQEENEEEEEEGLDAFTDENASEKSEHNEPIRIKGAVQISSNRTSISESEKEIGIRHSSSTTFSDDGHNNQSPAELADSGGFGASTSSGGGGGGGGASSSGGELEESIGSLKNRLYVVTRIAHLQHKMNEIIEDAISEQETVRHVMKKALEILAQSMTGATVIQARTMNESFQMRDYIHVVVPGAQSPANFDIICDSCDLHGLHRPQGQGWEILGLSLRYGDEVMGTVAVSFAGPKRAKDTQALDLDLVKTWAAEMNKFLRLIHALRRRHNLRQRIMEAARGTVLSDAFDTTFRLVSEYCTIDLMAFILFLPSPAEDVSIQFKVISNNIIVWDTMRDDILDGKISFPTAPAGDRSPAHPHGGGASGSGSAVSTSVGPLGHVGVVPNRNVSDFLAVINNNLEAILTENTFPLRQFFGLKEDCNDVVMRTNDGKNKALARVISMKRADSDLELLDVFTDTMLQQVSVYYSRWQSLSSSFCSKAVKSLLNIAGYKSRYLLPRVSECVIMYVDVAGFTRLSEEVLVDPTLILKFVDTWSDFAIRQIKARGGVFDKLVGDCAIAIWGPPFFNSRPEKMVLNAIECALTIRNWTRDVLVSDPNFPHIRNHGVDLGVSTGINICRLAVGFCGPAQGFTGFSSGMNETARLQGLAKKHEILLMESAVNTVDKIGYDFGDIEESNVKNVARPLRYRMLTTDAPIQVSMATPIHHSKSGGVSFGALNS
eukprot:comp22069_c0_seq1/m.51085 comp22069_c0_seq1/g.51085  ORF comp22069_c0_seq1/g.51085 comp22069_c0_seq1/m.51085 type:complete len:964 (+) comp22069_c0_seq1:70-2961(+)